MSPEKINKKIHKAHDTLLLIAMFSIVMLFAGLTSAYIVSKGALGSKWDVILLPNAFYISTLMIALSSFFGYRAQYYCKVDHFKMITRSLILTIFFGLAFSLFQFLGWKSLVESGRFISGNNVASSYLYVLTLTHIVHLLGGLIFLFIAFFNSLRKKYTLNNFHSLKLIIRFWHFLGLLWLYLFLFLLFIN